MSTPQNQFIGINVSADHVRAVLIVEYGSILKSKIEGISKDLVGQLAESSRNSVRPKWLQSAWQFLVW
jgi:hypothetical protein